MLIELSGEAQMVESEQFKGWIWGSSEDQTKTIKFQQLHKMLRFQNHVTNLGYSENSWGHTSVCEAVNDTSKTWRESGWEKKDQVMLL